MHFNCTRSTVQTSCSLFGDIGIGYLTGNGLLATWLSECSCRMLPASHGQLTLTEGCSRTNGNSILTWDLGRQQSTTVAGTTELAFYSGWFLTAHRLVSVWLAPSWFWITLCHCCQSLQPKEPLQLWMMMNNSSMDTGIVSWRSSICLNICIDIVLNFSCQICSKLKKAVPLLETLTWVKFGEGINRGNPSPYKCREAASNLRPSDSVRQFS